MDRLVHPNKSGTYSGDEVTKMTQLFEDKKLLTPKEVAVSLNISKSMVYKLISLNEFQVVRIGTSSRVPSDEVQRFVDRQTIPNND